MKLNVTKNKGSIDADLIMSIGILMTMVWIVSAWVTHIIVCVASESWGLLIAGALGAPIGVIHGTGYWFGFFH